MQQNLSLIYLRRFNGGKHPESLQLGERDFKISYYQPLYCSFVALRMLFFAFFAEEGSRSPAEG